jgi:tetratricopeptide (TPR) repeat protein
MGELIHDLEQYKKIKESEESIWSLILFKISNVKAKYWIGGGVLLIIVIGVILLLIPRFKYDIKSIAILPFRNESSNSSNNYISDGVSKILINALSSSNNLSVLQFSSVSEVRDQDNLDSIGRILNVHALLSGDLIKNVDAITIRAKLNLVPGNKEIWSKKYEGLYSDIYNIQDDIITCLHEIINFNYNPGVKQSIPRAKRIEAYDDYLRGYHFSDKYKKPDNEKAISFYEQSLEKDPTFVSSYIALANAQLMMVEWGWDKDYRWLIEADTNCRRALELDTTQSGAYSVLGRILLYSGETEKGKEYLERSITLNPHSSASYSLLGKEFLFSNTSRAFTYLIKAYEIEPNNFITVMNLAIGDAMMKDYRKAINYFKRAIELDSSNILPWSNLAVCYEHLGLYDSAASTYNAALTLDPTDAEIYENFGSLYVGQGKFQNAMRIFNEGLQFAQIKQRLLYLSGVTQLLLGNVAESRKKFNEGIVIAKSLAKDRSAEPEFHFYVAFFEARLGKSTEAIQSGQEAYQIDTTDEESSLNLARLYAVLGNKQLMLKWFDHAKQLNSEYDESTLYTYIDFYRYRDDPELLMIARR